MEEIRKHIENNLENATRNYNDTYNMWQTVEKDFKRLQEEFHSLGQAVTKARTEMEYYQKLLNELNEHNPIQ